MKTKKLLVLIALLIATLIMLPNTVNAAGEEFTEDFCKYKILEDNATVELIMNEDSNRETIEVPAKVNYNSTDYTVISIGEEAFKADYMLKTLILPYTIQTIGNSAFFDCVGGEYGELGLTNINVRNSNGLITENTLPTSLKTIGEHAFYRTPHLTNLAIPEGVTTIGMSAFSESGITSIVIPSSVTSIGSAAFAYSSIVNVDINANITEIPDSMFYICANLASVELPNTVKTIGNYAFNECPNLATINMPNSLETIGAFAFYGCALNNIQMPNTVTSVAYSAFDDGIKILGVYPGSVTGQALLAQTMVDLSDNYNATFNLINIQTKNETKENNSYCVELFADDGYILPQEIKVYINDQEAELYTEYNYTAESGIVAIMNNEITGNIRIEASAVRPQQRINFVLNDIASNYFTITDNYGIEIGSFVDANYGEEYNFRIQTQQGYIVGEVIINGNKTTIDSDYYEFTIVATEETTVEINGAQIQYEFITEAEEGATINPAGTTKVYGGEMKIVTVETEGAYGILSVQTITEYKNGTEPYISDKDVYNTQFYIDCPMDNNIKNIKFVVKTYKKYITTPQDFQEKLGGPEFAGISGNTIKLKKNVELDSEKTLHIKSGEYILDLNGHTISVKTEENSQMYAENIIELQGTSKLTIKDSSNGNGSIDGTNSFMAIYARERSILVIENGKYTSRNNVIIVEELAKVTINNGSFKSEESSAISCYSEIELYINGGTFEGGEIEWDGPEAYAPETAALRVMYDFEIQPKVVLKGGKFIGKEKMSILAVTYIDPDSDECKPIDVKTMLAEGYKFETAEELKTITAPLDEQNTDIYRSYITNLEVTVVKEQTDAPNSGETGGEQQQPGGGGEGTVAPDDTEEDKEQPGISEDESKDENLGKPEDDKKDENKEEQQPSAPEADKKDENKNEEKPNTNNPVTGDAVIIFAVILVISIIGIVVTMKMKKKN